MIAAAHARLPRVPFRLGGIEEWKDAGPFDVILANAVLHWVPDHATLLPSLVGRLGSGGSLAIQMPDNLDSPAHRLMRGGAAAVVEWFRGSGLRPFLEPLDAESRAAYVGRYTVAVSRAYPALPDGSVLLPFPRLFIVATR